MINKVHLIGRLGKDPEVRQAGNSNVANFSLATSERYKDKDGAQQEKTEWHNIVAWSKLADICGKYLKKGSLVYIEGTIQTRKWEDKDGKDRYTTEVKALNLSMLDSKPTAEAETETETTATQDDLPF